MGFKAAILLLSACFYRKSRLPNPFVRTALQDESGKTGSCRASRQCPRSGTRFAGAAREPARRPRPSSRCRLSALRLVGLCPSCPVRDAKPPWGHSADIPTPAGKLTDTHPFAVLASHARSAKKIPKPDPSGVYDFQPASRPRRVAFPADSFQKCLNRYSALPRFPGGRRFSPDRT